MNWNKWMRHIHRWFSVIFTLVVIINGVAVAMRKYTNSLGLLAVFVLLFLFSSGAYLFVLPYTARWRTRRRTG
jgi:hypothetical protein